MGRYYGKRVLLNGIDDRPLYENGITYFWQSKCLKFMHRKAYGKALNPLFFVNRFYLINIDDEKNEEYSHLKNTFLKGENYEKIA